MCFAKELRLGRWVAVATVLILIPALSAGVSATTLQDGLIGYWNLDETGGATAFDTAPDGIVADDGAYGTGSAAPTQITGKFGGALSFDEIDDEVLLGNSTDLDINSKGVTVSAWVYLDKLPTQLTGSFGGVFDSGQDDYVLYMDKTNNELRFKVTDSNGTAERPGIPAASLTTGGWHHVVGVYDGVAGQARIYYDGQLADTHTNANLVDNVRAGQIAGIGRDPSNAATVFPGDIDDVGVWNRALSATQIAHLYNSGSGNAVLEATPQPVIHWKFDGDYSNSGTLGAAGDAVLVSGTGSAAFTQGRIAQGLDLEALNQDTKTGGTYVKVDYQLPEQGTLMLWYYAEPFYNYQSILDNSQYQENWEMWTYSDGRLRMRITSGSGDTTYDLDNLAGSSHWYHIAYTWDKNNTTATAGNLYIDGVLRASDDIPTWIVPGSTFYLAGGNDGNEYGNGVWDDVRIYDQPLSALEVQATMADATPVLHWQLEGNLLNSGSGGSALDGTLVDDGGSASYATGVFGQGLDLNPSGLNDGHYAAVDYTLPDKGSMSLHYYVENYYNYQSIFDVAVEPNDWESWVDVNGVLHFRINDSLNVAVDLDNLKGPNQWYQIGVTWDKKDGTASDLSLYVDGELVSSVTNTAGWVEPGDTIYLGGGNAGNNYGNGVWDEWRIYDGIVLGEGGFAALVTVPEPGGLALLALGGAALLLVRRRKTPKSSV